MRPTKDRAYRCFSYNTYMMQDNGQSSDGPTDQVGFWWSDCYGEATRMYYYGLGAVPEWAPPDENHLLRSSSVVKFITYTNGGVNYTTWAAASTEVFRLSSVPGDVLADGISLPRRADLAQPGWTYDTNSRACFARATTARRRFKWSTRHRSKAAQPKPFPPARRGGTAPLLADEFHWFCARIHDQSAPTNWLTLTAAPAVVNGQFTITTTISAPGVFLPTQETLTFTPV